MYGYESWTLKNAFKLWCWRRLLKVPWISSRSNQWILKEINLENSFEGLMLKLQYFSYLMWSTYLLDKTMILGKIEGRRRMGWQRMRQLDGITDNGPAFEQIQGHSEGQGSLVWCSHKESDITVQLHNKNLLLWTQWNGRLIAPVFYISKASVKSDLIWVIF